MKICKYCKKPILDNWVWNPDNEGNGYHHACLCEMEFRLRDRQIYDKGGADVLDRLRAEIDGAMSDGMIHKATVLGIIDKYKANIESQSEDI